MKALPKGANDMPLGTRTVELQDAIMAAPAVTMPEVAPKLSALFDTLRADLPDQKWLINAVLADAIDDIQRILGKPITAPWEEPATIDEAA
jgi:hypothetical protein